MGYYVGADVRSRALGRFSVMYYDNNADPEALNRTEGHYAWDTRFGVLGYRGDLRRGMTFVTQAMYGETSMGRKLAWTGKRVSETTFFTAYGLFSQEYGRLRISVRGEYFETWDRDRMLATYDGSENGYGVTVNAAFKPRPDTKLSVEIRYLDHERPVRVFAGEDLRIDELGLRFSYRYFF